MLLEIITPEHTVLKDDVNSIQVPTEEGQIGILPHHVNLITTLTAGEIIINKEGKEKIIAVTGGFLQVHYNTVSILADYAASAEDIDVNQAIEAQKRAEAILEKRREDINERDLAIAEAELRKSILQINVGKRRKKNI